MFQFEFLSDIFVSTYFIGIFLPIFLYWFSTRNHDYWKKRNIPYVKPYPFIGSVELIRNSDEVELERYKKYGRVYGFYEGCSPAICIADPELLKKILVQDFHYFHSRRITDTGEPVVESSINNLKGRDWKRVRNIVSPKFTTGKLKKMLGIVEESAKTLMEKFKTYCETQKPIDVMKIYGTFTLDIRAVIAFSTKLEKLNIHNIPETKFVKEANLIFNPGFDFVNFFSLIIPEMMRAFGLKTVNTTHMDFFKNVAVEIIEERKKSGNTKNDFLQVLLDAVPQSSELEEKEAANTDANSYSKHLNTTEILAQSLVFFLAGYHTTTVAIALTTYYLALHEDIQEKVFQEIQQVLKETDGQLSYDSFLKMKYFDNVVCESLRINPPGLWLTRMAMADYELGDTGIKIPKGMTIRIPVYAMHRDPQFFPNPEKFDPDRFSQEGREKQIPYTYLPFGTGPRQCVGMRLALVKVKTCLTYVISTFKLIRCPDTKVPLEMDNTTQFLGPTSIQIRLEPRTNNPLKIKITQ